MKILYFIGQVAVDLFFFTKEFLLAFAEKIKKDSVFRKCFIIVWLFSLVIIPTKGLAAYGIWLAAVGIGTAIVLIAVYVCVTEITRRKIK